MHKCRHKGVGWRARARHYHWPHRCCPPFHAHPATTPLPPHPSPPAGLLKLVFATETLAAGINMPARTTLIAALSRRRDGAIGPLQHNELLQVGCWG